MWQIALRRGHRCAHQESIRPVLQDWVRSSRELFPKYKNMEWMRKLSKEQKDQRSSGATLDVQGSRHTTVTFRSWAASQKAWIHLVFNQSVSFLRTWARTKYSQQMIVKSPFFPSYNPGHYLDDPDIIFKLSSQSLLVWKVGEYPNFHFLSFHFSFFSVILSQWLIILCHSLTVCHLMRRRLPWKLVEIHIKFNREF